MPMTRHLVQLKADQPLALVETFVSASDQLALATMNAHGFYHGPDNAANGDALTSGIFIVDLPDGADGILLELDCIENDTKVGQTHVAWEGDIQDEASPYDGPLEPSGMN